MREPACTPAVAATGFTLKRLDEDQPAGLIDDRLRVEIRQSRFLVSDLTHRNPGAYWEAGYAEGLGKPVIYTCRKDVFEDKKSAPHFDTNHHLTVIWEAEDLDAAVVRLKTPFARHCRTRRCYVMNSDSIRDLTPCSCLGSQ